MVLTIRDLTRNRTRPTLRLAGVALGPGRLSVSPASLRRG